MLRPRLWLLWLRPGRAPVRWAATAVAPPTPTRPPAQRAAAAAGPRQERPRPGQEAAGRRRQDPALLDAVLAAALRSRPFYERRQERFVRSLADWLPGKADALAPSTMALMAKYLARHRLREPPLLESIAAFLLQRIEQLDSKVLQQLVFPFSRVNYRPSNHAQLFPQLESVLKRKPASPLATVNILLSLFQLHHFPLALLRKVFSPAFLLNVTSSPCGWIMRRYLSLLDAAVALEVHEYDGPRLDPQFRVQMFDGALTADEANCKYSFKGLVAEALRQLLGEGRFRQGEVLPPGYCTDFLLWILPSGVVLPVGCIAGFSTTDGAGARRGGVQTLPSDSPDLSPFSLELLGSPTVGSAPPLTLQDVDGSPSKEPSSLSSSPLDLGGSSSSSVPGGAPTWTAPPASPPLASLEGAVRGGPQKATEVSRVVLSVNDKWHYCQDSAILVGSRAMRDRHLRLLGYRLVQLPYMELEQVSGVQEAQRYLCRKLEEELRS